MTLGAFTWWYRVHRWTSLVCTVFVLVSCLTGLPLIFDDEIDRGAGKPVEPTALTVPVDLDTLVAVARTQRPRGVVQAVEGKTADSDAATASVKFDAWTGTVLREEPDLETDSCP